MLCIWLSTLHRKLREDDCDFPRPLQVRSKRLFSRAALQAWTEQPRRRKNGARLVGRRGAPRVLRRPGLAAAP